MQITLYVAIALDANTHKDAYNLLVGSLDHHTDGDYELLTLGWNSEEDGVPTAIRQLEVMQAAARDTASLRNAEDLWPCPECLGAGWAVFNADPDGTCPTGDGTPYLGDIQRCDSCGVLPSDDEAIEAARAAGYQVDDDRLIQAYPPGGASAETRSNDG